MLPQFSYIVATSCLIVLINHIGSANGHGRLIEPPSRATAWRYGFDTPPNYNDHELFCGGFARQWQKNAGKCGECGDAWDAPRPRPHELGGKWGQGVIVRKYKENSVMLLRVELTASHNGYFEFRLCPDSVGDQSCLDRYPLKLIGGEGNDGIKFFPRNGSKVYEMRAQLPQGLRCERCMLQWRYVAGNNWGTCPDGTGAVGCGPQEEFRACADISIGDVTSYVPTITNPDSTTTEKTSNATQTEKPKTDQTDSESSSHSTSIIIVLVTLLAVLATLAMVYLYFYKSGGGLRIKNLLMLGKDQQKKDVGNLENIGKVSDEPLAPPRLKKQSKTDDNDDEGLRTIALP
ncbi:uncharacterized protein LOC113365532, partial [Ctenocephalides felis]|uniref:uncharacterized protein LOC113365532 n=1 Tax=Ctenocephalides felis TaxID=7515 RepID=UPI000E6E54FF